MKTYEQEAFEQGAIEALAAAIAAVKEARRWVKERSSTDRHYAIVLTDLEKVAMVYDYIARSDS